MRPVTSKDLAGSTVQVVPGTRSTPGGRRRLARLHPGFLLVTVQGLSHEERRRLADADRPQTATALHDELAAARRGYRDRQLAPLGLGLGAIVLLLVAVLAPSGWSTVAFLFGAALLVAAWIGVRRRIRSDADATVERACLLAVRELELGSASGRRERAIRHREQAARWIEVASMALGTKMPGSRSPAAYRSEVRDQVRWAQRGLATIIGSVAAADPSDRHATEAVEEQLLKVVSLVQSGHWVAIGDVAGPGRPMATLTAAHSSALEVALLTTAAVLALVALAQVLT